MSSQYTTKVLQEIEKEIVKTDDEIVTLDNKRRKAIKKKGQLQKAHRALADVPPRDGDGKLNATLQHVSKAILIAYGSRTHMQSEQLESRVLQVMRGHDRFSERGLKRRVEQGLNRLQKDESGMLLRPEVNAASSPSANNDSSPTA